MSCSSGSRVVVRLVARVAPASAGLGVPRCRPVATKHRVQQDESCKHLGSSGKVSFYATVPYYALDRNPGPLKNERIWKTPSTPENSGDASDTDYYCDKDRANNYGYDYENYNDNLHYSYHYYYDDDYHYC